MEQRSKEWFDSRVGKITGSKISAILDISPFTKKKDVLREMVREYHGAEREFEGNHVTQWGVDHESVAINAYEIKTGHLVQEEGIIHHENGWLSYSPDGVVGKKLIEVKCPYSKKIPDEVPDHYLAQVQCGMYVMGLDDCDFVYWTPAEFKIFHVKKSERWADVVVPKLKEFHDLYLSELDNPEHLEDKILERDDSDWKKAVNYWRMSKNSLDLAKDQEAEARKKLIELSDGKTSEGNGVRVTVAERKGSIQYKKIPALEGVNLEDYRAKSSTTFTLREIK